MPPVPGISYPVGDGTVPGYLAKVTRMSYQRADAADAWQRIFAFFGEHLSG